MACAYNKQLTLELHQSQSLPVLHLCMPLQLVAAGQVLVLAAAERAVLLGAGLLLIQLALLVQALDIHDMET
jgi:hypothetical protein